jgi:hypothetical protein
MLPFRHALVIARYLGTAIYFVASVAALFFAAYVSQHAGNFLAVRYGIDSELIPEVIFFAVLGLEIYVFSLARNRWRWLFGPLI